MESKKPKKQIKKKVKKRLGIQSKTKKKPKKQLQTKKKKHTAAGKKFRFIMKDVRCFAGEQKFEIRPLTFLVGENSTGKTTALGCFHTLFDMTKFKFRFDFNEPPYELGSFDTIARRTVKKNQGVDPIQNRSFKLGFTCENPKAEYIVCFNKESDSAEPTVRHIKIKLKNMEADVSFEAENTSCRIFSFKDNSEFKWEFPKTNEDMKPIHKWIDSGVGRLIHSNHERIKNEFYHNGRMREYLTKRIQYGKVKFIEKDKVERAMGEIRKEHKKIKSDDLHILGLARASGTKLLCSNDHNLCYDFKKIIKGKIYNRRVDKRLLTRNICNS